MSPAVRLDTATVEMRKARTTRLVKIREAEPFSVFRAWYTYPLGPSTNGRSYAPAFVFSTRVI